jgi:endonuclease-3
VRTIRRRLAEVYGVPVMAPHGDGLGELVLTVLSQSTNDRNRDVAYLRLRDRFDGVAEAAGRRPPQPGPLDISWQAVRDAPVEEIEEAIRPGGISKVKSVRIKQIRVGIGEGGRDLNLDCMEHAPVK